MEVNRFVLILILISILTSCSNTPELETGEIKTLEILNQAFTQSNQAKQFIDARLLLSRKQIDEAKYPYFLSNSHRVKMQFNSLPGQRYWQNWLAADGATITMDRGVLKASRGMGNDLWDLHHLCHHGL